MASADYADSETGSVTPDGGRGADGRFTKRNAAAVKTGLRLKRAQLPETFDALEAEVQALLDGSLADDGGINDAHIVHGQNENNLALDLIFARARSK